MEYVISVLGDPASAIGTAQSLMVEEDVLTAVSIGSDKLDEMLRACISGGAKKVYRLMDKDFMGSDTWAVSRIYAAFIGKYCPDMHIMIFSCYSPTMPMLAHLLGAQQFCYVTEIGKDDEGIFVVQDYDGEVRRCRVPSGSIVSLLDKVGIPYSKMDSDVKIEVLGREDLELAVNSVGFKGSRVLVKEVC